MMSKKTIDGIHVNPEDEALAIAVANYKCNRRLLVPIKRNGFIYNLLCYWDTEEKCLMDYVTAEPIPKESIIPILNWKFVEGGIDIESEDTLYIIDKIKILDFFAYVGLQIPEDLSDVVTFMLDNSTKVSIEDNFMKFNRIKNQRKSKQRYGKKK